MYFVEIIMETKDARTGPFKVTDPIDEKRIYRFRIDDRLKIDLFSYQKLKRTGKQRIFRLEKKWEKFSSRDNTISKEEILQELNKKAEFLFIKNQVLAEINKRLEYDF